MKDGDRVLVLPYAEYGGQFTGFAGTIVRASSVCPNKVGVEIDDHKNPASKYKAFWFAKKNVQLIEREEIIMLNNYIITNIKFLEGSNDNILYSYALYDESIGVGDTVVVKTGHHGFALATIAEIAPAVAEPVKFGREIIARVDFSAYHERKQRAQRMAELKKSMDAKVKELQSYALYELLAEKDPVLKDMLTEFRAITSVCPLGKKEDE